MTTVEFLADLRSKGVRLWVEEDRLRYHAPRGVVTETIRSELASRKAEILDLLENSRPFLARSRVLFETPTVAGLAQSVDEITHTEHRLEALSLVPVSRAKPLPLSFAQQRLWFLNQLEPESPAYNEARAVRLKGALDVQALEWSLNQIIERHEVLRTTISLVDGNPIQRIADRRTIKLQGVDLSNRLPKEREAESRRLLQEAVRRPFDLSRDLTPRVLLLQFDEHEHILMVVKHHVASDGWSSRIFWQEISALYDASVYGRSHGLRELPVQYADYAAWQRDWFQGEVLQKQLSYWRKQLDDVPPLQLPTDRTRPAIQSFRGAKKSLVLAQNLSQALKALSRGEGVTLFMTLLAAFKTLLYRYTGQADIAIGSPIAGRNRAEIEGLIGFFVNTLVFRTGVSVSLTFRELLNRVRAICLDAYSHQDLPFEKLVEELQPQRNLSYNPLFQVTLQLNNAPRLLLKLPAVEVEDMELESEISKFDLSLSLSDRGEDISGRLHYNTDLFDESTISRMLSHFQVLLEGIVADPDRRISDLPILTDAEKHQLLMEWNDTKTEYPKDETIHRLFEARAMQSPDAVAVICAGRQLTYRELNKRANQLAHYLRKRGVGRESAVGICVERSVEMVVGLLGILKAGGTYLPLDPSYPKERLEFMLEDTRAPVLITQEHLLDRLPKLSVQIVCLDKDWPQISRQIEANPNSETAAENSAYIIYTSGSTGKPKGVAVSHRSVNRLVVNTDYIALSPMDVVGQASNTSFDAATFEIWGALLNGARLFLIANDTLLSPDALAAAIDQRGLTTLFLTTALFNQMVERIPAALGKLHHLLFGGEAVDPKRVRELLQNGPPKRLLHVYGPTETTTFASWYRIKRFTPDALTIPIGRPIANTQIYILDSNLSPVPIGITGELYIGGDGLALGYLNCSELTAEKFIPNPFSEDLDSRLYKTGDLARYLPDGNIEFLGRIDDQVKIRGYRIELGEIEAVLSQHPAVREAVVLAREDTPGDQRLVAYIVPHKQPGPSVSELRSYLQEKLPGYMVPSIFMFLKSLPLTANGKVDRKALPTPQGTRPELDEAFSVPRTPVEELLVNIWAEVLKLDKVGIHDNFFELGGHSLLATRVVSRIREVLRIELPLRTLFETPTIAGLADHIEAMRWARNAAAFSDMAVGLGLRPIGREKELPLSFAQQRLWFLDQLEPGSAVYNVPGALHIKGPLDVETLERSFSEIVRRHEALRTTFSIVAGEPVQVIAPPRSFPLHLEDLSHFSESKREEELRRLTLEEAEKPFDLCLGPLFRATLIRLDEDDRALLLTLHHIVSDGWSMELLYHELSVLYHAFISGQPSPLRELPIQYADFAAWQREWLRGEVLESQLSYWKKQLDGAPAALNLPTDRPRPVVQSFRGARHSVELAGELTQELKKLSRKKGVTLYMTLLAGFQTLLHRYSGQYDILVGSPIANRNRIEIEGLIGFFVNTLVLRTNYCGNPTFNELLEQVRETALEAYEHQDLPFEKLVEELRPNRDLGRTPLFQAMFVYQNTPARDLSIKGLDVVSIRGGGETAKFDLTLSVSEGVSGLRATVQYNTDLFDQATMVRMVGHFQVLLEGIVADTDRRISDLPILTEAEKHKLLVEWNETRRDYPKEKCIHQLFEEQVERTPDAVAVIFEDQQLTYKELNTRANQLAHYLRKLGVGAEVLVGICLERSLEMVIGLLGILKAGGAYVPLDPDYPKDRLDFMVEDAKVRVLLTQRQMLANLFQNGAQVICLDTDWPDISAESEEDPATEMTAENLAYVIYTSGSTGQPKGAMINHRGLCNRLHWMQEAYQLSQSDRVLQKTAFSFDVSVWEFFWPLITGARLVIARPGGHQDTRYLIELIKERKITTLHFVPSMLQLFLEEPHVDTCKTIRQVICSGEALSSDLQERFFERVTAKLHNLYGPTEASIDVTSWKCERRSDRVIVPIGRPIANTQIHLLDKFLYPVPIGVPGELHIAGVGLARGYLNRPELTSEKFIAHPFSADGTGRLYKTGDLARYLPDGKIEFLGRIDSQVKIRGYRIELGEIEAVLSQHPAVWQTVVVARDEALDKRLVAYVVHRNGADISVNELRGFLKHKLPEYMVPSVFVVLDALPLMANGKVDRKALPAPDQSRPELEQVYQVPRTPMEEMLAEIWREVLKLERVGIHDNFFDLGGHSLLATQVISRVRAAFQTEVPLRTLFEKPTVAELANAILAQQAATLDSGALTGILDEIEERSDAEAEHEHRRGQ